MCKIQRLIYFQKLSAICPDLISLSMECLVSMGLFCAKCIYSMKNLKVRIIQVNILSKVICSDTSS